ncbi:hypothetical protein [Treponema brennaborense]|uniref:Uncharacterized protein n=1 Tax=Treponema brennaborense (strain DSM 12168 / CIP 105900 / DD5/3) TaxID=906968 RepID=F4LNJ5_TREBD|nr:hypothetical protein [Treponema brennaborense]AEE15849.1 hypothetical protein Trebr_0404 [Treponema brennaborense DSM 12168]
MSKNRKKAIAVIVEGLSDKVSLESIFENYFENSSVKVAVMYCDITTEPNPITMTDPTPGDIISIISKRITDSLAIDRIRFPTDVERIIHIIDTDGAFISPEYVMEGTNNKIQYTENEIITNSRNQIEERNKAKRLIVQKLCKLQKIFDIPYQIFFFSRNLEHVLHNKIENLTDEDKKNLSNSFDDKYGEKKDLKSFLDFINDTNFAVPGTYSETWVFILKDKNSLKRYSNLNLLFKD